MRVLDVKQPLGCVFERLASVGRVQVGQEIIDQLCERRRQELIATRHAIGRRCRRAAPFLEPAASSWIARDSWPIEIVQVIDQVCGSCGRRLRSTAANKCSLVAHSAAVRSRSRTCSNLATAAAALSRGTCARGSRRRV